MMSSFFVGSLDDFHDPKKKLPEQLLSHFPQLQQKPQDTNQQQPQQLNQQHKQQNQQQKQPKQKQHRKNIQKLQEQVTHRSGRTVFSPFQLRIMQRKFNETMFPTALDYCALVQILQLPKRSISKWFQNQRLRTKSTADRNVRNKLNRNRTNSGAVSLRLQEVQETENGGVSREKEDFKEVTSIGKDSDEEVFDEFPQDYEFTTVRGNKEQEYEDEDEVEVEVEVEIKSSRMERSQYREPNTATQNLLRISPENIRELLHPDYLPFWLRVAAEADRLLLSNKTNGPVL